MKDDIGPLFKALDALKYEKVIHPITVEEIKKHQDAQVLKTMSVKLESFNNIITF